MAKYRLISKWGVRTFDTEAEYLAARANLREERKRMEEIVRNAPHHYSEASARAAYLRGDITSEEFEDAMTAIVLGQQ